MSSSSYYRSTSPGGRRIHNPARASDPYAQDSYGTRNTYSSPRASTDRVIPVSSTTYVNGRPAVEKVYESHGRPRRSTVDEQSRPPPSVTTVHASTRNRPTVVQPTSTRPRSPLPRLKDEKDAGYYSSSGTNASRHHKKLYSVDDGKAKLVADYDISKGHSHKPSLDRQTPTTSDPRRTSLDRSGYVTADYGGRAKQYHLTGNRDRTSAYADQDYAYAGSPSASRDAETRHRRRAGSVERPQSMLIDSYRSTPKDQGPPPSTRGFDKLNEGYGISRSNSTRQHRSSPNRPLYEDAGYASQDDYGGRRAARPRTNTLTVPGTEYDTPRPTNNRHSVAIVQDRPLDRAETFPLTREPMIREKYYDDRRDSALRYEDKRDRYDLERREPRPVERQPGQRYLDHSVERRGFGIRSGSQDPSGPHRSVEAFDPRAVVEARQPPPPLPTESRDYARPRETARTEPDRRDYYPEDLDRKDRDRPRDDYAESRRREKDDYRDERDYYESRDKESSRHHRDDRDKHRDSDREDRDRERDRDRGDRRRDKDPYESGLSSMLPAAMGAGLGAAALYGTGEVLKGKGKERERESASPPDREDRDRSRRNRETDPAQDFAHQPEDRERSRRTREPEPVQDYMPPPPPVVAPPPIDLHERGHIDNIDDGPAVTEKQSAAADAEEEYRRRLQQAQQETSRANSEASFDTRPPAEIPREQAYSRRDDRRHDRSSREPEFDDSPPPAQLRHDFSDESFSGGESVLDRHISEQAEIIDNSASTRRENRVRIVEPPNEEDKDDRPRGILKRPTPKFPEDPNPIREGVAPLKDVSLTHFKTLNPKHDILTSQAVKIKRHPARRPLDQNPTRARQPRRPRRSERAIRRARRPRHHPTRAVQRRDPETRRENETDPRSAARPGAVRKTRTKETRERTQSS